MGLTDQGPGREVSGARPGGLPSVVVGLDAFRDPDAIAGAFYGSVKVSYAPLATPQQVAEASANADAVVVATHSLTAGHIRAMSPRVQVIGRTGVGVDTVDLAAASAEGITVFNEPSYGEAEVASHALAMVLALWRKLPASDSFVRTGWRGRLDISPVMPVDEVTAGVIGCGRIGRTTVGFLLPLFGEVLVYDPFEPELPAGATRVASLDELLRRSHAVVLHVPLTDLTRGLLGRRELALLPSGAVVVNVGRGGVLDEDALAEMLRDGRLGGAGLDVFAEEPLPPGSPLLRAPSTLLTPHVAAYSGRSMWRLGTWTIGDAAHWVTRGGLLHGSVVVKGYR